MSRNHPLTRRPSPVRSMLLAAVALVALVFPGGPARAADWVLYTAPDHSFSISLPMTPEVKLDKTGSLQVVCSPSENETYIVESTDLKAYKEDVAERLFTVTLDGTAQAMKATVQSQEHHRVLGHPADDIKLLSKEGYHAWTRWLVVNDHFIQLMYVSTADNDQPHRFWDSFIIRP
ncbi:MAG TPA: hypothetical protein VNH42_05130 [Mariprofundaceae bacterium]|nr:hypothetical protein [Mariprofundaceae bacterium]